jgi:DNA polymerase
MIVAGDFETYYDKDYSLTRLSEVEYILDPRFETIMLALKLGAGPTRTYVGHEDIAAALSELDWENVAWLSHNTRFDGAILAWHFGHVPKLYLDTLSMARATTHWNIGRSSLKAVSDYLGLPPKGDEVVRALGKHLVDFSPEELDAYRAYCVRDNENCREIFDRLRPIFLASELQIIDLVLRMFILPQVLLDPKILAEHLAEVQAEKAAVLAEAGYIDKSIFSSTTKFVELLLQYGVEVPVKISRTTGSEIPAVAKNDRAFKELCQDDSLPVIVQAFLAARMSVKSTIEETRTQHLLRLSTKRWPVQGTGWGVVPLKYSGARTHRLSGDGGTNWQNFKRGSRIRAAVKAPEEFRIVHRDASQIEARMVAWLSNCLDLLTAFAEGDDVYCDFAGRIYGRRITREDTKERFIGKTSILSLGYASGPLTFRQMLFVGGVQVSEEEAKRIVYLYRDTFPEIPDLWKLGEGLITQMVSLSGRRSLSRLMYRITEQLILLPVQAGYDGLWLPNGLCISYPGLHYNVVNGEPAAFYFDPYNSPRKIYGAKVVENMSQALARIIVTDIAVRVYQLTGYHPFLSTHDSVDYCVPVSEVEDLDRELERQFGLAPNWAEGLPLASEGGWGVTLLDAERRVNT